MGGAGAGSGTGALTKRSSADALSTSPATEPSCLAGLGLELLMRPAFLGAEMAAIGEIRIENDSKRAIDSLTLWVSSGDIFFTVNGP